MTDDASAVLKSLGGRELGRTTYAFPGTTDFSSQLVEAKASGAKVICLANAGEDTANCLKQANEFGIPQSGATLGRITLQDYVIKSIGLEASQGLIAAIPWVWNMNPAARAFADRFSPLVHGNRPDFFRAGAYSGVSHYLKAAASLGVDPAKASGRAVAERMKAMPVDDPLYQGTVRPDGKFVHDIYVWATKTPAECKGSMGLLPPGQHGPGCTGVSVAPRRQLPAGEVLSRQCQSPRSPQCSCLPTSLGCGTRRWPWTSAPRCSTLRTRFRRAKSITPGSGPQPSSAADPAATSSVSTRSRNRGFGVPCGEDDLAAVLAQVPPTLTGSRGRSRRKSCFPTCQSSIRTITYGVRPGYPYLVPEFAADIGTGHNVVATVYADCGAFYRTDGPEHFKSMARRSSWSDKPRSPQAGDMARPGSPRPCSATPT